MEWFPLAAAAAGLVGALSGLAVPALITRIPEPETEDEISDEADAAAPSDITESIAPPEEPDDVLEEEKEPYATIAALPGLRWKCAVAAGLAAAVTGAVIGWSWGLLVWLFLVPVGVALAVVDWRTRLLPTWVIAPSYAVVVALTVLAAALEGDMDALVRAGWGWVVAGGTFLLLWIVYPKGMGYGDVRLSGVLGIALGFLGWGQLLVGVYAGFVLGGVGGTVLSLLRIVDRKSYPFGPFMLLGALVGVVLGEWVGGLYAR